MASLIKGITVTLYEPTLAGTDAFNNPVFEDTPVAVENVLVTPVETGGVVDGTQLRGKSAVYELSIPKSDNHIWEDRNVAFFGALWRTVGFQQSYIGQNVPLDWNRKVRAERYG